MKLTVKKIFSLYFFIVSSLMPQLVFATSEGDHPIYSPPQVLVKDIGIIGLASHDIFAWDKKTAQNTENGRLDLSTIFDYEGGKRWQKGGNPKNAENAPVYSVTMNLIKFYQHELKELKKVHTLSAEEVQYLARKKTVQYFHQMVKESFERMLQLPFPQEGINQAVTNSEQSVFRSLHDLLPGKIKFLGRPLLKNQLMTVTNPLFARFHLNEEELNQSIKSFDGDYDQEYQKIKIPFSRKVVNLKQIDQDFIAQYSPYQLTDLLSELALVGAGKIQLHETSFHHHLLDLFAKAICPINNQWMPQTIHCFE